MRVRGIAGAILGIAGNQVVARYKLVTGRRIHSATLVADARVPLGFRWGDPVAGIAVTAFICRVGYEVAADVVRRLADGMDPDLLTTVETAVAAVPGIERADARARWTGRALRVEVEDWVDPGRTVGDADAVGQLAAQAVSRRRPR